MLRPRDASPNLHPIHQHGLVFRVIGADLGKVSSHRTDTAASWRNETLDIAFVAGSSGDRALDRRAIEHHQTCLTGYLHPA